MARHSNQKLKILYLYKILQEQTNELHGMTLTEISDELSKYGIESGRKSLYDDMEALRFFGLDICSARDRYVRYYVKDRMFGTAELKLISDLLEDCGALTEKKRKALFKKLRGAGAVFDAGAFSDRCGRSAINEDLFNNIELICSAITDGKRMSFRCYEWNSRKQRIVTGGGETLTVSPWRLESVQGRYRMLGYDHASREVHIYYPDRKSVV